MQQAQEAKDFVAVNLGQISACSTSPRRTSSKCLRVALDASPTTVHAAIANGLQQPLADGKSIRRHDGGMFGGMAYGNP